MQPYQLLEQEIAQWMSFQTEQVSVCSSGSAALHLALEALHLSPGSKVIVPDYSMIAIPRAVVLADLRPIFVACDETLNVDPSLIDIACAEEDEIRAIVVVHTYGRQVDMRLIHDIANEYDLYVIEDMAEAHGVYPHQNSDAATWSFYQNKIVHGEEGGAVWSSCSESSQRIKELRNVGFTEHHDFWHTPKGWNHRLSNANAELVRHSFSGYYEEVKKRREQEYYYNKYCPEEWRLPKREAPWVYDIQIPGMTWETQLKVVQLLNEKVGIRARCGFKPNHMQKEFRDCRFYGSEAQSKRISEETMYLPLGDGTPTLERYYKYVFECIRSIIVA